MHKLSYSVQWLSGSSRGNQNGVVEGRSVGREREESEGKAMKKGPEIVLGREWCVGKGDVCVCSLSDRIRIKRGGAHSISQR